MCWVFGWEFVFKLFSVASLCYSDFLVCLVSGLMTWDPVSTSVVVLTTEVGSHVIRPDKVSWVYHEWIWDFSLRITKISNSVYLLIFYILLLCPHVFNSSNNCIVVIGIYICPSADSSFMHCLAVLLSQYTYLEIIVLGDFNNGGVTNASDYWKEFSIIYLNWSMNPPGQI